MVGNGKPIISSTVRDKSDSSGSDDSGAERDINNDSGNTKNIKIPHVDK